MSTACLDRDLLRRAYGDFLAVPGLATVGGWRCVQGPKAPLWHKMTRDHGATLIGSVGLDAFCVPGDLLPLVDPADAGSWAILLRDLAVAAEPAWADVAVNLTWHASPMPPGGPRWCWYLGHEEFRAESGRSAGDIMDPFITDESDPARALVLARIAVREREGR
jgi:hypothetical protein